MPRLSKEQREEVKEMLDKGLSRNEISRRMNTSRKTIYDLISRLKTTGSTDDHPRPGRPRIVPSRDESWLECADKERPFVCADCGKTFKLFHSLKNHLKTHQDEREYRCDQCGRGFISSSNFKRHMRTHTGEKPYICEYCARGFADLGSVRIHVRTHTGERPYKCHLCSKTCATAGNLHAHMKVHKGENGGEIPQPLYVNPPRYKSIPVFPQIELLKARNQHTLKEEESNNAEDSEAFDEDMIVKEENESDEDCPEDHQEEDGLEDHQEEDGLEDHQEEDNPHMLSVDVSSSCVTEFQENLPAKIEKDCDAFDDNIYPDQPKDLKRFCQGAAASPEFELPIPENQIKKEPDFEEERN